MKIDYKNGKIEWDNFSTINWSQSVSYRTEDFLSQDMLLLKYDNCLIDLGYYLYDNQGNGTFMIMVIETKNKSGEELVESWDKPFAKIPCLDQEDMLFQLQRAINIYPIIINR